MPGFSAAVILPLGFSALQFQLPAVPQAEAPSPVGAVAEFQHLATVDNDNDGRRFLLSARLDSTGKLTQLRDFSADNPGEGKVFEAGPAMSRCASTGADRLDRYRGCGVEMEHARGDTSAIRLFTPDFNPTAGGRVVLFYLKRYAIFGAHDVGTLELAIRRTGDDWSLSIDTPSGPRRVLGLFIHRASRGIGLITACVDGACPADWPRRGRDANDGLPPVWGAPGYYVSMP